MSSTTGSRPTPRRPRGDGDLTMQELLLLEEKAPEACRVLLEQKRLDQQHRRRIAWANLTVQTMGHVTGLMALSILAIVAWHAIDRGASTAGATIICSGAVSIVAVFVTGRLAGGRSRAAAPPRRAAELPRQDAEGAVP